MPSQNPDLVITGGQICDVALGRLRSNPSLGVHEGIISVPVDNDSATDSNKTSVLRLNAGDVILPGLINLHEHYTYRATYGPPRKSIESPRNKQVIRAVRNAHLSLARGITTVRELGARYDINTTLRDAVAEGMLVGPQTFSCGSPLSITGGHAWYIGKEVDGSRALRSAVRQLAKDGVDWVKVMASHDPVQRPGGGQLTKPQYTLEELRVIVEEAHAADIRVTAHAMGTQAIERCLDAGMDSIEHGVYMTPEQATRMRDQGTSLIPTISSYRRTIWPEYGRGNEWSERHKLLIDQYTESTAQAIASGVDIGIGTDSIGEFVEEMSILVELGLPVDDVMRSATIGGAGIVNATDNLGSISEGKRADMVIIEGDPYKNLAHLRQIRYVLSRGAVYAPEDFQVSLTSSELVPGM